MTAGSRKLLTRCLRAALAAVDGRRVVASALAELDLPRGCPVLAVGKAAPAMLAGARDALGARIGPVLGVAQEGSARPGEPDTLTGDHPLPGARSLAAGQAVLRFLDDLPAGAPLLCLWSGGSSALLEALPEGVTAADLVRANRWLLGNGLPITAVNRVRTALSCLKGGRLAARLPGRAVTLLVLSDVPGDDPGAVGSGPWTPSPPTALPDGLPGWLEALAQCAPLAPVPGDPGLAKVTGRVIANGWQALQAAGGVAAENGLPVSLHEAPLQGDATTTATELLGAIAAGSPGLLGWWGETTMRLPVQVGRGGRNSHLALALAAGLEGRNDVTVLCAATDGRDGTGPWAGGWADGGVIERGTALGLNARAALAAADSGTYLAATGDALAGGATGTNVMDLVLALRRA
jgi:glycerate 2-kinase